MMGVETSIYVYVHNHFRLIDLPWDNPITWYAALLTVDFAYYWAHRASHGKQTFTHTKNLFRKILYANTLMMLMNSELTSYSSSKSIFGNNCNATQSSNAHICMHMKLFICKIINK